MASSESMTKYFELLVYSVPDGQQIPLNIVDIRSLRNIIIMLDCILSKELHELESGIAYSTADLVTRLDNTRAEFHQLIKSIADLATLEAANDHHFVIPINCNGPPMHTLKSVLISSRNWLQTLPEACSVQANMTEFLVGLSYTRLVAYLNDDPAYVPIPEYIPPTNNASTSS